MKIKVIIVEDEVATAQFIETVLKNNCTALGVSGTATSVEEALSLIETQSPDIVLLDIELGDGTAFDLLKKVKNPSFITVFLTAYQGYALQAIKFSAFDYILKPFHPDELVTTLERAAKVLRTKQGNQRIPIATLLDNLEHTNVQDKKIVLRTGSDVYVHKLKEVLYCKADSSYTHFYFVNNQHVTISRRLKEFEKTFGDIGFVRCHNSYLVNVIHVKRYRKSAPPYLFLDNGEAIPVSMRNKDKIAAIFK